MCRNRRDEKQASIRRLIDAGCPIDVDPLPDGLIIRQEGDALIMDMGHGYVGVVLYLMLAGDAPTRIVVEKFGDVRLPGVDLSVIWFDPLPGTSPATAYTLPNSWSFDRGDVLNDKLGESGITLRPGHHVEGYVLGSAKTTIPAKYKHGALLQAQFSVIDVVGREYRRDVAFLLDRKGGRISLPAVPKGAGLFEPCDPPVALIEDRSGSARQRLGGPVQQQHNAAAETKVPPNSKERLSPTLEKTPGSA